MIEYPLTVNDITVSQYVDIWEAIETIEDREDLAKEIVCITCKGVDESTPFSSKGDTIPLSILTEQKDITINRLFFHIQELLSTYTPIERDVFFYKGETYKLDTKGIKTGQTIEMMEHPKGYEGTKFQFAFTKFLYLCATGLFKEGEKLPYQPTIRKKWIEDRLNYFQDIPFSYAKDLDFFLSERLKESQKTGGMSSFLKDYPKIQQLISQASNI